MMTDPLSLPSSSSYSSLLPPGVVFKPTEREILQEFLTRKVHNLPLPNNAIVEMDVYDHQPWLYASGHNYGMDQYETYYFVRREKKSKPKFETAKNPKRHLKSEGNSSRGGWWKAVTGDKPIRNKKGRIIGFKKTLKFCTYKDQKYDRRECIKTDWIMHEYKLPHPTFQEWVVCGIRYNGGKGTGQEYGSGCHSTLDYALGRRQECEEEQSQCPDQHLQLEGCSMLEDQQVQARQDSPYDQIYNASSQLNIGSDGQCCWANVQEYFGLNEHEYALGCQLTLDYASGRWQECEEEQSQCPDQHLQQEGCSMLEDQQAQARQDSPYNQVCNASSQLNMGSDGQSCWANAQEYFGLNEQEYASGCHSTLDNQQARDNNRSLDLIDYPSRNEFEDTEGSQVQFPQISFRERELEDGRLHFDLWT